jgi:hypothetical protein
MSPTSCQTAPPRNRASNYSIKRDGAEILDLRKIDLATGTDRALDYADHAGIDGSDPVFHARTGRAAFVRDGNLFVREPEAALPRQLTRAGETDRLPVFSPDGSMIHFQRGGQWWSHDLDTALNWPVTDLRFEKDPDAEPEDEPGSDAASAVLQPARRPR